MQLWKHLARGCGAGGLRPPTGVRQSPCILPHLLLHYHRRLDFTTAFLPNVNEDKPVTADSEVISLPAPEWPVFCIWQWLSCIVDLRASGRIPANSVSGWPSCLLLNSSRWFWLDFRGFTNAKGRDIRKTPGEERREPLSSKACKTNMEGRGKQRLIGHRNPSAESIKTTVVLACHVVVKNLLAHPPVQHSV